MAKQKFNAGDLVELKAGGPKMVIERVIAPYSGGGYKYECTWFSGAKHNSQIFTEESLSAFEDDAT